MNHEAYTHPTVKSALQRAYDVMAGWVDTLDDRKDKPWRGYHDVRPRYDAEANQVIAGEVKHRSDREVAQLSMIGWPGVELAERIACSILSAKWPDPWEEVLDDMLTDYAGQRERRETVGDVFQRFDAWVAAGGPWDDERGGPLLGEVADA